MSEPTIQVSHLTKEYRLGSGRSGYRTLRESLSNTAGRLLRRQSGPRRAEKLTHVALSDVSFNVMRGEAIGVIGRNGAGKSTLLKLLSRITAPTMGQIDLLGRVGSLLEVGTGFHPELSGRENIYLNGAVLGMSRREIASRFDQIVEFSEVSRFLDTPVKRYSSGMYMRLAFAVAAHLEPEILLVDEVLAVGDIAFQRKCLGKMKDVATHGRTVMFVTHQLSSVMELCDRAILLDNGRVAADGKPADVIKKYLAVNNEQPQVLQLEKVYRPLEGREGMQLRSVELTSANKPSPWGVPFGEQIQFCFTVYCRKAIRGFELGIGLFSPLGFEIASSLSSHDGPSPDMAAGEYQVTVEYHGLNLVPGTYYCGVGIRSEFGFEDYLPKAFDFDVTASEAGNSRRIPTLGGVLVPDAKYNITRLGDAA